MKIKVVAIGNLKEKYLVEAQNEYLKRLSRFCDVSVIELSEKNLDGDVKRSLALEKEEIKKHLQGYVIALDIEGKQMSSTEFSLKLDKLKLDGEGAFTFVIGSSYGLDEEIKQSAKLRLSFSKMTFPHQIARIVLLEQIYRAFTISENITYHK